MPNCAIGLFKIVSRQLFLESIQMWCYQYVEYTYVILAVMYMKKKVKYSYCFDHSLITLDIATY